MYRCLKREGRDIDSSALDLSFVTMITEINLTHPFEGYA